ncbi:MAG: hypothetical protein HY687_03300 [Chloroflexi bacterium]|nr:hypothetical protein [Chloroflexota bacterium]
MLKVEIISHRKEDWESPVVATVWLEEKTGKVSVTGPRAELIKELYLKEDSFVLIQQGNVFRKIYLRDNPWLYLTHLYNEITGTMMRATEPMRVDDR